jgi:hypothetical protein
MLIGNRAMPLSDDLCPVIRVLLCFLLAAATVQCTRSGDTLGEGFALHNFFYVYAPTFCEGTPGGKLFATPSLAFAAPVGQNTMTDQGGDVVMRVFHESMSCASYHVTGSRQMVAHVALPHARLLFEMPSGASALGEPPPLLACPGHLFHAPTTTPFYLPSLPLRKVDARVNVGHCGLHMKRGQLWHEAHVLTSTSFPALR